MSPELCLIRGIYPYNVYSKYYNNINLEYIKSTNKELYTLLETVSQFHEKYPETDLPSVSDHQLFFHTQYPALPQKERLVYEALFERLEGVDVKPELIEGYLDASRTRQDGHRIALLGLDVAEGRKDLKTAQEALGVILERGSAAALESPFVSTSLRGVYEARVKTPGLRWRLKALNQMLGPLRKGDYGFVFARPETGKTTFLASEVTYMATQLAESAPPILWFNNEQEGHTVIQYCYRAALGLTDQQLYAKLEENEEEYEKLIGNRIRIHDSANIYHKDVEGYLRHYGASLIIFDQIDKIKGFETDRNDLQLGSIYQWARELSKTYAPVIGICQAGESGADKRWLSMEDVVNAKTSKQAEADWILGIGKLNQEGYERVRHLHLSKNKLSGGSETVGNLRHGKRDVLIAPEISRYKDIEQ